MDPGCHRPRVPGAGAGRVPDSHLRSRQVANWARWQQISECGLLHQLPDRSAPRLTECRLTFEMPVVSEVDTAGASTSTPPMECTQSPTHLRLLCRGVPTFL